MNTSIAVGSFWPPLAIVIAGGVGGATILATILIPSTYVLVRPWVERNTMVEQPPEESSEARFEATRETIREELTLALMTADAQDKGALPKLLAAT